MLIVYNIILSFSAGSVIVEFHSIFSTLYLASDLIKYTKEALGITEQNFQFGMFLIDGGSTHLEGLCVMLY